MKIIVLLTGLCVAVMGCTPVANNDQANSELSGQGKAVVYQTHNRQHTPGYDGSVFSFARRNDQQHWIVVSNFSATRAHQFDLQLPAALVNSWGLYARSYRMASRLGKHA